MRILLTLVAAALLGTPLLPQAAAAEVSTEFFYQTLDPYGDWIQSADYGYVWHPKDVAEDWRPYTVGSWAYTDAGWTWVSEEPYGAIVYHYGRWTNLADTGWVWVPDSQWGPAWVSWRRSEANVGWAPLPPEASFKNDVGISSWSDSYYDIGPTQYSFVKVADFGSPRLATVILPRQENVRVIRETRNITNITYRNDVVFDGGPEYDVIVRESREPVRRLRLDRRQDVVYEGREVRGDSLKATIAGDALRVFAPSVVFRGEVAPQRVSRRIDRVEVDRGWRHVDEGQRQELRTHLQADTARPPASLPPKAQFSRAGASQGTFGNARGGFSPQAAGSVANPAASPGFNPASPGAAAAGASPRTMERPLGDAGRPASPGAEPVTNPAEPGTDPSRPPGANARRQGTEAGAAATPSATPASRKPGKNGKGGAPTPAAAAERGLPAGSPETPGPGARPDRKHPPGSPAADAQDPAAPASRGPAGMKGDRARPEAPSPSPDGTPAAPHEPGNRPGRGGEAAPSAAARGEAPARPEAGATPEGARPERARPEGAKPEKNRPEADGSRPPGSPAKSSRPEADRPAAPAPAGADAGRPPREPGERPGHAEARPGAPAAAAHPGAPAASPAAKGKGEKGEKGDKDKDKDR